MINGTVVTHIYGRDVIDTAKIDASESVAVLNTYRKRAQIIDYLPGHLYFEETFRPGPTVRCFGGHDTSLLAWKSRQARSRMRSE